MRCPAAENSSVRLYDARNTNLPRRYGGLRPFYFNGCNRLPNLNGRFFCRRRLYCALRFSFNELFMHPGKAILIAMPGRSIQGETNLVPIIRSSDNGYLLALPGTADYFGAYRRIRTYIDSVFFDYAYKGKILFCGQGAEE